VKVTAQVLSRFYQSSKFFKGHSSSAATGEMDSMMSGIKKFDGTEFEVWSTLMEAVLTAKGISYVLEECKTESEASRARYDADSKQARALILISLSEDMVKLVLACPTASEVWNRLKDCHSQRSESCKMLLYQEFYGAVMDPGTKISAYVAKVELIARKLRDVGVPMDDDTLISKIVSGLPAEYKHFMSTWMSTPTNERSYAKLLPRLLAEESIVAPVANSVAMKMTVNRNSKGKQRRDIKDIECFYCNKKGHLKKDCRKRKRDEKDKEPDSEQPSGASEKKYAVVAQSDRSTTDSWLFDSGASFHMTGNLEWIRDYRKFSNKIPIEVGNCEFLYAEGSGSIDAISMVNGDPVAITLQNVHYVQNVSDNLFSQGAADAQGATIIASKGRISVMSGETVIIQGAKQAGNVYRLDIRPKLQAKISRARRSLEEWHRTLGHPDINEVRHMASINCTTGFEVAEDLVDPKGCGDCQSGKGHHVSHPSSGRDRSAEILHRVHTDLVGPISPPSLAGSKYFMLMRDEYSSFMHVYFMASKVQVTHAIKKYLNEVTVATQRRIQILRSDNGTEFHNTAIKLLCESEGIVQEFSAPYTAQQNGEIERANRTIIETARTLLSSSKLPLSLWGESVLTAVYLRNRLTNKRNRDKTPFELYYGRPPLLAHLVEFGAEIHVLDASKGISKFSSKTKEAFFIGYGDRINTYRCYDPIANDVLISSDVVVASHKSTTSANLKANAPFVTFLIDRSDDQGGKDQPPITSQPVAPASTPIVAPASAAAPVHRPVTAPDEQSVARSDATFIFNSDGSRTSINPHIDLPEPDVTIARQLVNRADDIGPQIPTRKSSLGRFTEQGRSNVTGAAQRTDTTSDSSTLALPTPPQLSERRTDAAVSSHTADALPASLEPTSVRPKRNVISRYMNKMAIASGYEPNTYKEALGCEDSRHWSEAIEAELAAHHENGTWTLVPKPQGVSEIDSRWLFKVKLDSAGKVERYKARLVARGFLQKEGIDYQEIYSPVIRMDSLRLLFSICAQRDYQFKQFDITTAFLYGEVQETLYLKPPEGLNVAGGFTCLLKKSLYGLKQAPRCWNQKFTSMLAQFNMKPLSCDQSVYVCQKPEPIYLALYVDDGLVFAKHQATIDKLLECLKSHFKVKVINSRCFLGIEIHRSREGICLTQKTYTNRLLSRFDMSECKAAPTPMQVGHNLNKEEVLSTAVITDVPYPQALGGLMYLLITRPDIAQTLGVLSKYSSCPRQAHWVAVKRLFRYLKGTANFGLFYPSNAKPVIECFSDADHAGDQENRKSVTGTIVFLGGPISYKSQQQASVAISTCEAEFVAATNSVKDIIWLKRFADELGIKIEGIPQLYCDNQSSIKLIKNAEFHHRTKHIDTRHCFIRDQYNDKVFEVEYVASEDNKADIFTKALPAEQFAQLRSAINCIKVE